MDENVHRVCFLSTLDRLFDVCLVRSEFFTGSLDIVHVTDRTAEIALCCKVPEAGRKRLINHLGYPPTPGCFCILVTAPPQNIDEDLFVNPLTAL